MKLVTLLDKVRASLRDKGLDVHAQGDLHPMDIDIVVQHTVKALGFEVAPNGDIYNPARDDGSIANMPQHVRYAGMPTRHRRGAKVRR